VRDVGHLLALDEVLGPQPFRC